MSDKPLDGRAIRAILEEVAGELPADGPVHTLVIVGGSRLALQGLRDSTVDVDSVRRLDAELQTAVRAVAARHGLNPTWLNDHSAPFAPVTLQERDCPLLLQSDRLRVLGAPLSQVFLMKLYAARARDYDDLVALWPQAGFASPEAAADAFREGFPHAPDDEYLSEFVREVAERAEAER